MSNGGGPVANCDGGVGPTRMTITDRLRNEKGNLENRLNDVNNALDALEADPKVAETLELLSKVTSF